MALDIEQDKLFFPALGNIFMFQNSYVAWAILIAYVSFSTFLGPGIMKKRKPLELQWLMILYNAALIATNIFLSISLSRLVYALWPYRCDIQQSPIFRDLEKYNNVAVLGYFVKFAELFDTVFFILRKKNNQVSFLHVFHHSAVYTLCWICLKNNLLGFQVLLIGSINCSVHVVLYMYYGLTALGPGVRKYLWWKKYLTKLQIIQFFVLMIYMAFNFMTGCDSFGSFEKVYFTSLIIITVLFFNFYNHEYKGK